MNQIGKQENFDFFVFKSTRELSQGDEKTK